VHLMSNFIASVLRNEERSRTVLAVVVGLAGIVAVFLAAWMWH
jgi:hypothetical protein